MAHIVVPGGAYRGHFVVTRPSDGAVVDADSLPTAAARHNGELDTDWALQVARLTLGEYAVSGTVPSEYTPGDDVTIVRAAEISEVATAAIVDRLQVVSAAAYAACIGSEPPEEEEEEEEDEEEMATWNGLSWPRTVATVLVTPSVVTVSPGDTIDLAISYSAARTATGLSIGVHYPSAIFEWIEPTIALNDSTLMLYSKVAPPRPPHPSQDDGRADTDRRAVLAWVEPWGNWPLRLATSAAHTVALATLHMQVRPTTRRGTTYFVWLTYDTPPSWYYSLTDDTSRYVRVVVE